MTGKLIKAAFHDSAALRACILAVIGCAISFIIAFNIKGTVGMVCQIGCYFFSLLQLSAFGKRVAALAEELEKKE